MVVLVLELFFSDFVGVGWLVIDTSHLSSKIIIFMKPCI